MRRFRSNPGIERIQDSIQSDTMIPLQIFSVARSIALALNYSTMVSATPIALLAMTDEGQFAM